ncbi:MAG: hypothetical protein HOK81_06555 [Rhodospirillaceae bacterium]|nr:hypothetical protein [Rhodospirillaceae bacterium]
MPYFRVLAVSFGRPPAAAFAAPQFGQNAAVAAKDRPHWEQKTVLIA